MMVNQLCSGFGQYHSPENSVEPRPYATITLDGIEAMVAKPQEIDKAKAQWVIPSTLLTRKHNEQRENGEFHALWADVDEPDGLTLEEIFSRAGSVIPGNFLAYTSRSATLERQKSRLYIPLEPPVNGSDYVRLQRILNNKLEAVGITPDRATERAGQICYLPNHGEFYDFQKQTTQGAFSADRWRAELEEEKAIEEATKTRMEADKRLAVTKARQRMESGCKSPIDAFNAEFSIPMMLESFGYLKKCDRWLSPNSSSKAAGVSLSSDGRKWLSSHGSDSGIGRAAANGTMGDAFDLFVYYQHNGNRDAAIKEAGEMFTTADGLTISKANQRAYMAAKGATEIDSNGFFSSENEQETLEPTPVEEVELLKPPGLAGEICDYMNLVARRPCPELYPLAALHLMALVGRHRKSIYTKKLNLMTLAIAPTASGKDKPQEIVKRMAKELKCSNMILGSAGSFKDMIYNLLEGDGASLYIVDEVHSFLNSMKSKNAQSYETKMEAEILIMNTTELYTFRGMEKRSLLDRYKLEAKELENKLEDVAGNSEKNEKLTHALNKTKRRIDWLENGLDSPFFSLMGHSVPERLDSFVQVDNIDSGFLGRTLITNCPETRRELCRNPVDDETSSRAMRNILARLETVKKSTTQVEADQAAQTELDRLIDWFDDDEQRNHPIVGGIYARATEHLYRIASILALEEGTITVDHVRYANALVRKSIEHVKHILLKAYANSDKAGEREVMEHARYTILRNCKSRGQPQSTLRQLVEKPKGWKALQAKTGTRDRFIELLEWMIIQKELEKVTQGRKERYISRACV